MAEISDKFFIGEEGYMTSALLDSDVIYFGLSDDKTSELLKKLEDKKIIIDKKSSTKSITYKVNENGSTAFAPLETIFPDLKSSSLDQVILRNYQWCIILQSVSESHGGDRRLGGEYYSKQGIDVNIVYKGEDVRLFKDVKSAIMRTYMAKYLDANLAKSLGAQVNPEISILR